jgi:hypothetical protein
MTQRPLKQFALLLAGAFLALSAACGPSSEGESKTWTKNQELVTEHSKTWPGFKTVLEADQKEAKGMWEEAGKIGDEKQKAEKMKATNAFQNEMLSKLGEIKSKNDSIDKTAKKLNKLKLKGSQSSTRKKVVKQLYEAKSKVASKMSSAAPTTKEEAMTILKEQTSTLTSAWMKGVSTQKKLEPKKKKKEKKKKDKKDK